jgi:hypothetical protein
MSNLTELWTVIIIIIIIIYLFIYFYATIFIWVISLQQY